MPCADSPGGASEAILECPVRNWCVCEWAFSGYIGKAGGCATRRLTYQLTSTACRVTVHRRRRRDQGHQLQRDERTRFIALRGQGPGGRRRARVPRVALRARRQDGRRGVQGLRQEGALGRGPELSAHIKVNSVESPSAAGTPPPGPARRPGHLSKRTTMTRRRATIAYRGTGRASHPRRRYNWDPRRRTRVKH